METIRWWRQWGKATHSTALNANYLMEDEGASNWQGLTWTHSSSGCSFACSMKTTTILFPWGTTNNPAILCTEWFVYNDPKWGQWFHEELDVESFLLLLWCICLRTLIWRLCGENQWDLLIVELMTAQVGNSASFHCMPSSTEATCWHRDVVLCVALVSY